MKRSPIPLIIGLLVLFITFMGAIIGLSAILVGGTAGTSLMPALGDKVALLEINGVIGEGSSYDADTARLGKAVRKWAKDDSVKGMIIRINSPGGAVSATQELYDAIMEFKKSSGGRPVYASMGDIAASGGYYIASASDRIYANPGSLTGSIGVIMNFFAYQELADKIGVKPRIIKSGEFKDIGAGFREMTEEEKALLEETVDSVFEQFFEVVLSSRHETVRQKLLEERDLQEDELAHEDIEAYVRGYCDGRIFSGQQAYETGMIDRIGTMQETVSALKKALQIQKEIRFVKPPPPPRTGLFGKVERQFDVLSRHSPGSVALEFRYVL